MPLAEPSAFRVEKVRIEAVIDLTNGARVTGDFFVAQASPTLFGQERVAEMLNAETGFLPFEVRDDAGARTALLQPRPDRDGRASRRRGAPRSRLRRRHARTVSLLTVGWPADSRLGARLPAGRTRPAERLGAPRRHIPLHRNGRDDLPRQHGPRDRNQRGTQR